MKKLKKGQLLRAKYTSHKWDQNSLHLPIFVYNAHNKEKDYIEFGDIFMYVKKIYKPKIGHIVLFSFKMNSLVIVANCDYHNLLDMFDFI